MKREISIKRIGHYAAGQALDPSKPYFMEFYEDGVLKIESITEVQYTSLIEQLAEQHPGLTGVMTRNRDC